MLQKTFFTQIQSGKFKGKKLFLPNLETTRSTKNRVKACVFNVLRTELMGKVFVEVFGGSGAMALEALSNGALSCFCIEKDVRAYEIALKNAALADNQKVKVFKGDSFELLETLLQNHIVDKMSVIAYFDPPFHVRSGFEDIYERVFKLIAHLQGFNVEICIIEHSSKITMPQNIGVFIQSKMKKFGHTSLSFYRKRS